MGRNMRDKHDNIWPIMREKLVSNVYKDGFEFCIS